MSYLSLVLAIVYQCQFALFKRENSLRYATLGVTVETLGKGYSAKDYKHKQCLILYTAHSRVILFIVLCKIFFP